MKIKNTLIFLIFLFGISVINAQKLWTPVLEKNNTFSKENLTFRKTVPTAYKIYTLDINLFKSTLQKSSNTNEVIEIPTAFGKSQKFLVKETSNLAPELAAKYRMIQSFSAQGIDDPTAVAKISIGTDGVHVMIQSGKAETFYIDPYTKNNQNYIAYRRGSLERENDFSCFVEETKINDVPSLYVSRNPNDSKLRTYRMAVVCSGEYAQFHLNQQGVPSSANDTTKKTAVLSAINTTMTRVNGVYERDLSVKFELVANNDQIVFLDAATDNITDGNPGTMINEVQTICDAQIGDANYDIGHIFSTGGSGLAGLAVVCVTGQKARGVTGRSTPMGDPYDIDYVAHEIGHQFGANHTQNNNCNRVNAVAVEPGSASTIMGYAGICSPNVQNNSDDHFHAVNIAEMWNIIQSSGTCSVQTDTNNATPTAYAGVDVTIPKSTPFVLRGVGSDTDGNSSLTYNWEQIDNEIATMPPLASNTGGPAFRSLSSSTSPNRYMPNLSTVIAGSTANTWEVVPSVSRTMNFSLLVRDNNAGGGSIDRDDIKVTVDGNSGPFAVTSQTTNTTWYVGSTETITWDVAGTDSGSVNTPTVNILLSTDGGQTFPYTLASNVPNDGSAIVTIPNIGSATTTARIIVEGNGNLFYAMNSTDFSIDETEFTFNFVNPNLEVCSPDDAVYTFTYNTYQGFNGTTTFSASNLPTNASITFNPTSAITDGTTVTVTISDIGNVTLGNYNFNIVGTSGAVTNATAISLNVLSDVFVDVTLTSPGNGATGEGLNPTLTWNADANATSYDLEIATDSNFSNIIHAGNHITNTYTIASALNQTTTYYWRVKPKNNCGIGNFSAPFSFTTQSCSVCPSAGNTTYETSTTLVIFNTINNASTKKDNNNVTQGYFDYTGTINTSVQRGSTHDLTVNVNTDGTYTVRTKVWIDWNQNCSFDDAGEEYDLGSANDVVNGATSNSPLSITVPVDAVIGSTTMRVSSRYSSYSTACANAFDGEVEDYKIIVEATAGINDYTFKSFNLYPNPSNGDFNLSFEVIDTEKVIIKLFDLNGRVISEKKFINIPTIFSERFSFKDVSTGIYLLRVINGSKQTSKKVIIK